MTRSRTSLSAVTNYAQMPFAFDYEGRAPFDEASGREALGNHALSHFYQTSEGWIFLDASEAELDKLAGVEGLKGVQQSDDIQAFLNEAFAKAPAAYWAEVLREANIAVAEPQSIEHLRELYTREADNTVGIDRGSFAFQVYPNHPSGHVITQIDQYSIRPTEASITAFRPTERFGHSTRSVLAEIGYSETEVESMIERKIAGLGWGKEFLPS